MDTREAIMNAARLAVQARGYNALSFRDLAAEVGVKSASVHYHFPTKGDLGAALARRYTQEAESFLATLSIAAEDIDRTIASYTGVFRAALENDNRMCLCGIMLAEHEDLPAGVKKEVAAFTDANVGWLDRLLESVSPALKPQERLERAAAIFSAIEGAQLVARGAGELASFDRAIRAYRACGFIP